MKDRLEQITKHCKWGEDNHILGNVSYEDVRWLIQQAERVQGLEKGNDKLKWESAGAAYKQWGNLEWLRKENKRYREALDRIVSETDHGSEGLDAETDLYHALEIAWKALESEEG